jgi:hypothetical protein
MTRKTSRQPAIITDEQREAVTVEQITLHDGTELSQAQSIAAYLHATEQHMSFDLIAVQAGYASGSSVRGFLQSAKGRAGVEACLRQHLLPAARIALHTMIELAQKAKSENVRQLAAADLLDRAGFTKKQDHRAQGDSPSTPTGGVSISINLGGDSPPTVIEADFQQIEPD